MNRSDTREHILDTAVQLFTELGYDAVGVQPLCEAAKITKPTLYHWFGSKHGVLQAAVERYADEILQNLEPCLRYHGDLPDTLQRLIGAMLAAAERQPAAIRLFLSLQHAPQRSESRRAAAVFFDALHASTTQLFISASSDHGNMIGREQGYAVSFLATVFGYIELVLNNQLQADQHLAYRIMHQFSHGIYS
ncbi:TetR/AcrR family transcriptional regulator [Spirochaeta africana]|uniref:Transcriptional regulator n=1 Tax=Spirochaeta africana (strain ATCC 700263 / DSM 8902 / Z-7692) TaxID=889378 RepID=H9UFC7_SPIAZ|nr:TetR/AcrR family transcriptional regulator [Spirochaeta africana]AFG36220.1 transcriptional regulator [Spirochaeta africana DSM 8902]